jgi:transitional endoplasmic reticulum ATPase
VVATESEANFISIKGPEIFSKWVGESEKAIREIFRKGRTAAPAVIFVDEVDSIIPRRGGGYSDSGVTERVVSQLLTELDGLEPLQNVVVIAATNRPDILDPSLLRPGRFDRLIYIPPPDDNSRLQILKIYTKKIPIAEGISLEGLTQSTRGYSGADIQAVCNEAAMNALRRGSKIVEQPDFSKALEMIGPTITPEVEKWYQSVIQQFRKPTRPSTVIA